MNAEYRIGIDIGGTKVNAGLMREDGAIVDHTVFPSEGADRPEAFVARICHELRGLMDRSGLAMDDIAHIGVGIPGTADSDRGVVEYSCNLLGRDVPLGDLFRAHLGRDVTVVQDSWAAAYAEHRFGAGRGRPNMLCVTIGTGIGCGVILGGKVFAGALGTAGEMGHTPVVWQGRPCSCGRRGCLEAYASGSAIWAQAEERFPDRLRGRPQRAETVFDLVAEGDAEARALVDECVDKLAYGLAIMVDILSVDTVILSGGVSMHRALVVDPLRARILRYGYPSWTRKDRLDVLPASLGPDAPMAGAAFLTGHDMTKG